MLVWQDEVHFQIQATVAAVWARKGSRPKVKSHPGRQKASYSGFVIPDSGELFAAEPDAFNFETTVSSLRSFLSARPAPPGKRYAIVMDNASWHRKAFRVIWKERDPEYDDIRRAAIAVRLPPYSPDLNPIEQVWRVARRENTHNRFFPSLEALKEKVGSAFDAWSRPNDQLRKLCGGKSN